MTQNNDLAQTRTLDICMGKKEILMNIFDNIFDENLITVYWKRWKDPTEQVV
jgi:hypothetical protein